MRGYILNAFARQDPRQAPIGVYTTSEAHERSDTHGIHTSTTATQSFSSRPSAVSTNVWQRTDESTGWKTATCSGGRSCPRSCSRRRPLCSSSTNATCSHRSSGAASVSGTTCTATETGQTTWSMRRNASRLLLALRVYATTDAYPRLPQTSRSISATFSRRTHQNHGLSVYIRHRSSYV